MNIQRNIKQINVTLRVNLKDGGARGLEDGDKIPQKEINNYGKTPLKKRTHSFKDLEDLALEGLRYHWGRNKKHSVAKNVMINDDLYEVFIKPVNTEKNSIDDIDLIFKTNRKWMRSGNPGTVEGPLSLVGPIVSREAICFNGGYIKYSKKGGYSESYNEEKEFRFTSAHEVGHSILKAYGGTIYSYGHKGSVNVITQNRKESVDSYPKNGEIDMMPYYSTTPPYNNYDRYAASEDDVISLIWLTKTEVK